MVRVRKRVNNPLVEQKLKALVAELIAGDFERMEAEGRIPPRTAEGTREAIERYPGKITMPPDKAFRTVLGIFEVPVYGPDQLRVEVLEMYLWFSGEQSDLYVKVICIYRKNGQIDLIARGLLS